MKKRLLIVTSVIISIGLLGGCVTEAVKVDHNISVQSDYFECNRRITVYNARTDLMICQIEGYMNITNNSYNELVVTCKVGQGQYKKNFISLTDNVIYIVEDITGVFTDPYHYVVSFNKNILPTFEVRP